MAQLNNVSSQVSIMPLGNTITHGKILRSNDGTLVEHISYRRALWMKLQKGEYAVDFVGSESTYVGAKDYDVHHEGHSGFRADQISDNIIHWATAARPDIVLLHGGTNDLLQRQNARNDLAKVIDKLRVANPTATILIIE